MLDKQLAYAEYLGIKPVVIINKTDLADTYKHIVEIYTKAGYTVIATNAKGKQGIDKVKELLKGKISALSGNSGVGKSTTINELFKAERKFETMPLGFVSTDDLIKSEAPKDKKEEHIHFPARFSCCGAPYRSGTLSYRRAFQSAL